MNPRALLGWTVAACFGGSLIIEGEGGARAESFRLERLSAPGRVLGIVAEDLNADGRRDLVAVSAAQGKRAISIYLDKGTGFSPQPDQTLVAPRNASFLDVGDVDGDGKRAVVLGDRKGLLALHMKGALLDPTPRRFLGADGSLLSLGQDDDLPILDLVRDWDGDGKAEILLPQVDGTGVFVRGAEGWQHAGDLRLLPQPHYLARSQMYEPRARNFAVRATFTIPELASADFDGDGKLDLCAIVEDVLQVHKGGGATVFSILPQARIGLGVRSEAEAARGAHVYTIVRDLDGDGVADLAVNKIVGGLGQMRAQTGFYYGRKGGGFERPAQLIEREGYTGALAFGDLDGDGKPDLLMPHVAVGLAEMARALLSKRMTVGFEVRRNLGRQFSVVPEATRDVDFTVDTSVVADVEGPFPSVAGDFNGDGRADLLAPLGADSMGVWLGGGKSLLEGSPKAVLRVATSRYFQIADLDGDKRADVIVFYRNKEALHGTIVVARNTGRGW